MADIKEEDKLIAKAVVWAAQASEEIRKVGGSPPYVLELFSDKLIATMVRNNLNIKAYYG